jgi:arylformamidase
MSPFGRFTADDMEGQYNLRQLRPDYETAVVPGWLTQSERARTDLDCKLDVAYGASAKQKLDVFRAPGVNRPTLIYFHGGYWQRGDKSIYSFLAHSFVAQGVNVVLAGYDLCPTVSITTISRQAREALAWTWRNAGDFGIDRDQITVMGHSAGGHITGMMMGTDWSAMASGLPRDLLKAGIPISPLNLLEPLRHTTIGDALKMDSAEAERESPMNNPPVTNAPQLVVCGGKETEEFHRQSDMYVEAFATTDRKMERYSVPDCDHFDELNALADKNHDFFKKSLALITAH